MGQRPRGTSTDDGFTLVELLVALTVIGGVLVSLAFLLTGAMGSLAAARQRSVVTELANLEMEKVRATVWDSVGVSTATDPDYSAQYPGGQFGSRDAVPAIGTAVPAAKTIVTVAPVAAMPVPYTVERWITWTDTAGGATHQLKRIDIKITYTENGHSTRSQSLSSVMYPGATATGVAVNQSPVGDFTGPSSIVQNSSATFDSTGSDPDGDPITYRWDFGDGSPTSSVGPSVSHVYSVTGNFTVVHTIEDDRGGSFVVSHPITVAAPPPNQAPSSSFTIAFDASRRDVINVTSTSTDPEGDPMTFIWNWGDGTPDSTGVASGHRYLSTGPKTITLTVSDPGHTVASTQVHNVSTVGCSIISASFRQTGQPADNQIHINSSNPGISRANPNTFTFTATTTLPCSSIGARLPLESGSTAINTSTSTVSGSVRTFSWSGDTGNNRFNSSSPQNAQFWTPSSDGSAHQFTVPFTLV